MRVLSTASVPIGFDFSNRTKLKKLVAILILCSLSIYVGCAFAVIGLVSAGIGLLNQMGVFGDGKLSEILGYVAIIGSVVGFAGNMMYPGGGIGPGYGPDGFGIGYPTSQYQNAAGLHLAMQNGQIPTESQVNDFINSDSFDRGAAENLIRNHGDVVDSFGQHMQGQWEHTRLVSDIQSVGGGITGQSGAGVTQGGQGAGSIAGSLGSGGAGAVGSTSTSTIRLADGTKWTPGQGRQITWGHLTPYQQMQMSQHLQSGGQCPAWFDPSGTGANTLPVQGITTPPPAVTPSPTSIKS